MIALVAAGVLALVAGGVAVLTSGGSEVASPQGPVCCFDSSDPGSQSPLATQATDFPTATPDPGTSTKPVVSTTPRPSSTTRGPSPTQTQGQPPQLNGSSNAVCAGGSGTWSITITVTATLAEAASGTNPNGHASLGGSTTPLSFSGSSGTTFVGQATVNAGPDTAPASGSIQWTVTVSLPGGGTVSDQGSEGFSCTPASP
jgi:hypothetical protein